MWDVKKPHFLVGFDPSLSSEKLKIPPKFMTNLEGRTSGTVSLEGPSGNTWHVNLIQHDEGLFFNEGWETFVTDNFLGRGDSLVFRYDGDLNFTVQVFDHTSCEKDDSFKAVCSQDPRDYVNPMVKKRDRENSALLDSIVEGVPKKIRSSQVHSDSMTKNHEMGIYIDDKEGCPQGGMACLGETTQASNYYVGMDDSSSTIKNSVTIAVPLQAIVGSDIREVAINRAGKEGILMSAWEAERIARAFTSSLPNFTKVMKRFNISGSYTLNIPYQFATVHLPKCKLKIVLSNLKGESWTVNSIPTTRVQTSHTFCGGWLAFVRDNNINMGDICIFELVRKFELRVRILRVGKGGLEDPSFKLVHEETVNGCAAASHKIPGRRTKKLKGNSHNMYLQQVTDGEISNKKASDLSSALYSLSKICNGESDVQKKNSSLHKQGSHAKGCMSIKSAPEEKLAARSFVSSFPHFVRIMKKFNVSGSYTLKIPYQFSMEHLPNCRTEIILRNLKGQCWSVNSVPTTKVQTLHTFCGGWMTFVRDNEIQMGDICIFELVGDCEMRVHICGIGKKGLNYQSGRVVSDEAGIRSLTNNSLA